MTTRSVGLAELPKYLGKYISFEWSDGWDHYSFSGWLHGIDDEHYVYIDDDAVLGESDDHFKSLGGVRCTDRDRFVVYFAPPAWARSSGQ